MKRAPADAGVSAFLVKLLRCIIITMIYSHSEIDRVGEIIRHERFDDDYYDAVKVLNNWREAHGAILDKFFDKCVKLSRKIDKDIIVAQRLKRLPTIIDKLNRLDDMRLHRMQDIAGVRLIVKDMDELDVVAKKIRKWKDFERSKNYIDNPKTTGYRGMHFIFKSEGYYVEIQLRTQLQHLWATSVETTDIFRGTSMKTRGDDTYWNEFFLSVSSAFAYVEDSIVLPEYANFGLISTLLKMKKIINRYDILSSLETMAFTNEVSQDSRFYKAYYILMDVDFEKKKCSVICAKEKDYDGLIKEYARLESDRKRRHSVVFVAVDDFRKLKDAYPNYFVDLNYFRSIIKFMLENTKNEVKI